MTGLYGHVENNYSGAYMGACQNCGPFLGPYNNKVPNIQGTQTETILVTTTHTLNPKT